MIPYVSPSSSTLKLSHTRRRHVRLSTSSASIICVGQDGGQSLRVSVCV